MLAVNKLKAAIKASEKSYFVRQQRPRRLSVSQSVPPPPAAGNAAAANVAAINRTILQPVTTITHPIPSTLMNVLSTVRRCAVHSSLHFDDRLISRGPGRPLTICCVLSVKDSLGVGDAYNISPCIATLNVVIKPGRQRHSPFVSFCVVSA